MKNKTFLFYSSFWIFIFIISCVNYRFDHIKDFESKKDEDSLIRVLRIDKDDYIRSQAAQSLGRLKSKKAVSALIYSLNDKSWTVRYYAAESLGIIKVRRGKKALKARLKIEDDENVIETIKLALKRLG